MKNLKKLLILMLPLSVFILSGCVEREQTNITITPTPTPEVKLKFEPIKPSYIPKGFELIEKVVSWEGDKIEYEYKHIETEPQRVIEHITISEKIWDSLPEKMAFYMG
jgi:hypothetical protein